MAKTRKTKKTTLTVEVEYNPRKTDPEGLACAMDRLLETALSIPGGHGRVREADHRRVLRRQGNGCDTGTEGRLEYGWRPCARGVRFGPGNHGGAGGLGHGRHVIRQTTALSRFPMGAVARNWRTWPNAPWSRWKQLAGTETEAALKAAGLDLDATGRFRPNGCPQDQTPVLRNHRDVGERERGGRAG